MPPKKKPQLSIARIAIKKSAAAKARLEKIKSDPVLLGQHKEKERLKYLNKKENCQRKTVKDMTSCEHRKIKTEWKKYSANYRKNLKLQKVCDNNVAENTSPVSDDESIGEPVAPELLIHNENKTDDEVYQDYAELESLKQEEISINTDNFEFKQDFLDIDYELNENEPMDTSGIINQQVKNLDDVVKRLKDISSVNENEFMAFGRSVAVQLQKLPLDLAVQLQADIQAKISQTRLRYLQQSEEEINESE